MTNKNLTATIKQDFDDAKLELVKRQFGLEKASAFEVDHFFAVAKQLQLDPLSKQIYGVPYGDKITIMVSIDGARAVASRSGDYAGVDTPEYAYRADGALESATVTVYKIVQGQRCGFQAIAFNDEFNTGKNVWASKPKTMLAKCAEMAALRKAFPVEFNKVYEPAEVQERVVEVEAEPVETLSDYQTSVLLDLSMLAKPKQDRALASSRISKLAAEDYPDYLKMGLDLLVKKEAINQQTANDIFAAGVDETLTVEQLQKVVGA